MPRLARAKLNLYLEVVGRRPDGYHELRTLFRTVAWGDDVEVARTPRPGVTCTTRGADLPDDARNLAVAAARAWLAAAGDPGGVEVQLTKRVPLGGGLGGGSADAAAVLVALDATAGARALGADALRRVAAGLGSDVPFLVEGGAAVATGRGEVLAAVAPGPAVEVVLILPPFGTETARVYARCAERVRRAPPGGLEAAVAALAAGDPAAIRAAHHNDLAEAALRAYPALLRYTADVERRLGRPPAMTGSGSTLFDVPDRGGAAAVLEALAGLPGRREVVRTG